MFLPPFVVAISSSPVIVVIPRASTHRLSGPDALHAVCVSNRQPGPARSPLKPRTPRTQPQPGRELRRARLRRSLPGESPSGVPRRGRLAGQHWPPRRRESPRADRVSTRQESQGCSWQQPQHERLSSNSGRDGMRGKGRPQVTRRTCAPTARFALEMPMLSADQGAPGGRSRVQAVNCRPSRPGRWRPRSE